MTRGRKTFFCASVVLKGLLKIPKGPWGVFSGRDLKDVQAKRKNQKKVERKGTNSS